MHSPILSKNSNNNILFYFHFYFYFYLEFTYTRSPININKFEELVNNLNNASTSKKITSNSTTANLFAKLDAKFDAKFDSDNGTTTEEEYEDYEPIQMDTDKNILENNYREDSNSDDEFFNNQNVDENHEILNHDVDTIPMEILKGINIINYYGVIFAK